MKNSSITSAKPLTEPEGVESTFGARALIATIELYQRLRTGRISACRFYPSCSTYAIEAIDVHGAWRGTGLALRRLLRCRPLGPHGVDPVPEVKNVRSIQR